MPGLTPGLRAVDGEAAGQGWALPIMTAPATTLAQPSPIGRPFADAAPSSARSFTTPMAPSTSSPHVSSGEVRRRARTSPLITTVAARAPRPVPPRAPTHSSPRTSSRALSRALASSSSRPSRSKTTWSALVRVSTWRPSATTSSGLESYASTSRRASTSRPPCSSQSPGTSSRPPSCSKPRPSRLSSTSRSVTTWPGSSRTRSSSSSRSFIRCRFEEKRSGLVALFLWPF